MGPRVPAPSVSFVPWGFALSREGRLTDVPPAFQPRGKRTDEWACRQLPMCVMVHTISMGNALAKTYLTAPSNLKGGWVVWSSWGATPKRRKKRELQGLTRSPVITRLFRNETGTLIKVF